MSLVEVNPNAQGHAQLEALVRGALDSKSSYHIPPGGLILRGAVNSAQPGLFVAYTALRTDEGDKVTIRQEWHSPKVGPAHQYECGLAVVELGKGSGMKLSVDPGHGRASIVSIYHALSLSMCAYFDRSERLNDANDPRLQLLVKRMHRLHGFRDPEVAGVLGKVGLI